MKKLFLIFLFAWLSNLILAQSPRYQQITSAEYFVNTDPGEGNGTPITGNFGYWEAELNVNNIDLPVDSKMYVRVKSSNGTWSTPRSIKRENYFPNSGANLSYGEYFINSDPGLGNGTFIDISSGVTLINNLNLSRGDKIYVRVKDSFNRWSQAEGVKYNFKDLIKAEYYVKKFSGGTTQPDQMIISSPSDFSCVFIAQKENINFSVQDTFYVRFQSDDKFISQWTKGPLVDPTSIRLTNDLPTEFNLFQNYPNPFNPVTKISFTIPNVTSVKLEIFNILGQRIETLLNKELNGGSYEYSWDANSYPSGVYIYHIEAGRYAYNRKMILLK